MFLICGLGNPGVKYTNTRHNIGFKLADKLISNFNFNKVKEDKYKESYSWKIQDFKVLIFKPRSYMNLLGKTLL